MDIITISKITAILGTIFLIYRNDEKSSNYIGGILIISFGLTIPKLPNLMSAGLILYILTLTITIWLLVKSKIKTDSRSFTIIFLAGFFVKEGFFLNFPNYAIFYYLTFALVLLYFYFLYRRSASVLVITTIPAVDYLITLYSLL
ncbi:hypothetical protein MATR_22620 [Marivirga tractuosa]|uniref:Uncharacterized protein n=1 Tax=Marivirga tractuosa (strain ATCC 23168 / DSM 4126 / NBRC 15989 / NCIMB 1408 / VKM B-1430 / H-43) TaxID=643867 RepID=E4TVJ0_MARTH|nr:hypothetical protein Ftrac_0111 [Marivirga tractuosa DSM 4126]BDD15437.1 hypothetical protein MATR_22620 [Marivirga tractuosa]